jgi:hypothetical protein
VIRIVSLVPGAKEALFALGLGLQVVGSRTSATTRRPPRRCPA